eukprot:SAG31_NODE_64_length_28590_cov_17.914464_19_plen_74_part_00
MRDGMRRSMVRQLMANGGDQAMVESMEAEIDEMTRQLEAKMQKISKRKSGGGAGRCVAQFAALAIGPHAFIVP